MLAVNFVTLWRKMKNLGFDDTSYSVRVEIEHNSMGRYIYGSSIEPLRSDK